MIIKRKLYSTPARQENTPQDVNVLKTLGKTGLGIAGAAGIAAGAETGRSLYHIASTYDDFKQVKKS